MTFVAVKASEMRVALLTACRLVALLVLALTVVAACGSAVDDPPARRKVVDLARAGALAPRGDDDWIGLLPDDLEHTSTGGEVAITRLGDRLIVVFFDFRGLNHYTGWVYDSADALTEDPLGNRPFKADRIEANWFRVDAG